MKRLSLIFLSGLLVGCGDETLESSSLPKERWQYSYSNVGKMWQEDLVLYGKDQKPEISEAVLQATVKSLQSFSMKVVDLARGIFQTEWQILEGHPHDRFKINVIVEPSLGVDVTALKVSVVRQKLVNGQWQLTGGSKALESAIKSDILLNARHIVAKAEKTKAKNP